MTMPRLPLLRALGWLAFAAITLGLLLGLVQQQVDPSNRALKAPDSADAAALLELARVVPPDPVLLLAFRHRLDGPLLPADAATLTELRQRLAAAPGVLAVDAAPLPDPGLQLFPIRLAGADLLATARAVIALAEAHAPPTVQVLATGLPLLEGRIAELVAGERTTIVPLLLGVLFAAAWLFYRRLAFAIAVLLPPVVAIAWTGGAIACLGHRLDPIAALLDPVLLTIGVATSVHFVDSHRRALAAGLAGPAAAAHAAAELRTPALLATATTMIGLWSLCTSAMPAVFDFGLRSALGVGLTHLFAFLLLPPWLAATAPAIGPLPLPAALGERWLAALRRAAIPLLMLLGALTAFGAMGLPRLAADNDPLRLLPADEPARIDHDLLAARLGGVEVFHLLLPAGNAASVPARCLPLLAEVRQRDGVAGLAGPAMRHPDGTLAVPLLLRPGGSGSRAPLFDSIEQTAALLGADGLGCAGPSVQIARDSQRLLHSLGQSYGLSLGLLCLGMVVGLRSLRLGLLATAPNVLPAVWLYGGLGWLGRPVSVATAMIGCTMLGLIVDNTLHLLHHYRLARAELPRRAALVVALDRCGRAISLASAVLMLGFATALVSRLTTTVEFALLATATIGAAWVGTMVALPLWLSWSARRSASAPTGVSS
jgi:uncharacterized protein